MSEKLSRSPADCTRQRATKLVAVPSQASSNGNWRELSAVCLLLITTASAINTSTTTAAANHCPSWL